MSTQPGANIKPGSLHCPLPYQLWSPKLKYYPKCYQEDLITSTGYSFIQQSIQQYFNILIATGVKKQ